MEDERENENVEQRSGGDGDAGAGAAEAELRAAEEVLATEQDDGDEGSSSEEGKEGAKPSRLQRRIKGLVESRKAYEKFGKPDDLARKLAKLDEYERLEARIKKEDAQKEAKAREESGEAQIGRRMRGYLDQTYGPGAAEKIEWLMRSEEDRERRAAIQYAKQGRDHIKAILSENAVPTEDPAVVQAYEHAMATFIGENQNLLDQYNDPNTQRDALAGAFKFAASKLLNPILASAGVGTYEQLAARKARALGSGRGTSAGSAVDIADEKPPKNATPEQIHEWHKRRASRAWDAALDADEATLG